MHLFSALLRVILRFRERIQAGGLFAGVIGSVKKQMGPSNFLVNLKFIVTIFSIRKVA